MPASLRTRRCAARRIRTVGLLVLSFMVLALMGLQFMIGWMAADADVLAAVTRFASGLGLGGTASFVGVVLLIDKTTDEPYGRATLPICGRRWPPTHPTAAPVPPRA